MIIIAGNVHHKHDIITTSKVMALQNKYNKSDIGGGPVMDSCAINAALKGCFRKYSILLLYTYYLVLHIKLLYCISFSQLYRNQVEELK